MGETFDEGKPLSLTKQRLCNVAPSGILLFSRADFEIEEVGMRTNRKKNI